MRSIDLDTITLSAGAHDSLESGACVMEMVAYVAGEPWTDAPQCASPVIAAFCRAWNDTDDPYGAAIRERLKTYIPRLVGSRGTPEQEQRRAWLATDWLIRVHAPAWLRLAGLTAHADILASLPPQTSHEAVRASAAASAAAWSAAWDAARDAAGAAAWSAAWSAASAAARDAARAAARDAASAAAWDAAWPAASAAAWSAASAAASAAAWSAARDAARDALQPTVEALQASAWTLLDALLEVTDEQPAREGGQA